VTTVSTDFKGSKLDVRPLTVRTGAEIVGIDLRQKLDDSTVAAIRWALLSHKVVFFRDQQIDIEGQLAFAHTFGDLTAAHPTVPGRDEAPDVLELDSHAGGRADHWHTDVTFTDRPPAISLLRAVVIPPVGGDTIWANTVTAYEGLSNELRHLADQLRAVHTNTYDYARAKETATLDEATRQRRARFVSTVYETEHPVVRIHPETEERSLLLGGFAHHIVGFSSGESADLIRTFQHHVTSPENTIRWRWREGDVAVWDNRATQHYAVNDYGSAHRVVQRATIAGSIPVGTDRRQSVALKGDASAYSPVVR
jgi:alpha-ketoglutarate-dependent taurine dioxygenase